MYMCTGTQMPKDIFDPEAGKFAYVGYIPFASYSNQKCC